MHTAIPTVTHVPYVIPGQRRTTVAMWSDKMVVFLYGCPSSIKIVLFGYRSTFEDVLVEQIPRINNSDLLSNLIFLLFFRMGFDTKCFVSDHQRVGRRDVCYQIQGV